MVDRSSGPALRPVTFRHDFEQTEHYHLIIEGRMKEKGIVRGEAYRQFVDEALGRSAFRVNTTRELARRIRERALKVANAAGGDIAREMAAIIKDVQRIEEVA